MVVGSHLVVVLSWSEKLLRIEKLNSPSMCLLEGSAQGSTCQEMTELWE